MPLARIRQQLAGIGAGSEARVGYLAALATMLIWSGFILVSRLGGRSGLTAYDILALRLATASFLLTIFAQRIPLMHWRDKRLWSLAMLGGVGYGILVYTGFRTAPAAHGGILLPGIQPFLIAIITWAVWGDRWASRHLPGYLFIAAGVAFTAVPLLRGEHPPGQWQGDLWLVCASVIWAWFSVLAKRWSFQPWLLTRFVAIASALVYLPIYALFLPKGLSQASTSAIVIQALYQGIGPTILAMMLFLKAVSLLGPARVSAIIALVPVLAGLAAVPLLGEPLSGWLIAGLLAVSCGAYFASRPVPIVPTEP